MKRREGRRAQSADLLVCFPSRAHLALMPKPICSPARPTEPSKRHHSRHPHHQRRRHQQPQQHHHHLTRKSSTRIGAGQASPLLWSKSKQLGSDISEPTSPKVTCAGQIKVKHKNTTCKSWQSVMEEIERIHNEKKQKKRSSWMESLGFKKEVMQFLTCLRSIRFDFRCFGSFPQSDITTDDDEYDEEEDEELQGSHVRGKGNDGNGAASRTVFSRWFMVLQENQNNGFCREEEREKQRVDGDESLAAAPSVPPQNALLLMRSRSAPAKSWLEEKEEEEEEEEEEEDGEEEKNSKIEERKGKNLKSLMEEEKIKDKRESLLLMGHDCDFYKISSDIAKETWVVGGMRSDPFSRSRSWKR